MQPVTPIEKLSLLIKSSMDSNMLEDETFLDLRNQL